MSKILGPKWSFSNQLQPSTRAVTQHRRLGRDEVRRLCSICNEAFITTAEDPSKTCNNPCVDPIEIVRDAKNDLAFDFQCTNDGSGYDLALRILRRMKEAA